MTPQQASRPIWRAPWFALTICLALVILNLVPAISSLVQHLDQVCARSLNQLVGLNPILDRLMVLIVDNDGQERIILLVVAWFLVGLWFAPSRLEKSRQMALLLFCTITLSIYFLLDGLLDDIITRDSPSIHFLRPGFRDLQKFVDTNIDVTDRRSFPNVMGMILFTLGFILLRMGKRFTAWTTLALAATLPLMCVIVGMTWLTDVYLGALPISFLISALAVETRFFKLHNRLLDLSAAGFDQAERFGRSLRPMWKHRRLYWISQNVFHVEVAVKRFTHKEIPALLDPKSELAGESPRLEVPLGGLRSVVRIASLGPRKAVIRAYPLNRRFELEQHAAAARKLHKHNVRAPQILHELDNPYTYGALFLVEEFVEGESKRPEELTDENIASAAQQLAQLHNISQEVWGPLAQPRTEEYGNVLMRRIDRQLGQVERGAVLKGQQVNSAKVRAWFGRWRDQLNAVKTFSLVHGKLHRENGVFGPDGQFCFLDVTTSEWGIAASDLIQVHSSQCGNQPELVRQFDDVYFASLNTDIAAINRELLPLYEALFSLGQVAKYTKRLSRVKKRQVGDAINKGMHWWQRLLEQIEIPRPARD